MRRAILPAVGAAALAVALVGCGSSGKSTVGLNSPVLGNSTKTDTNTNTDTSGGPGSGPAASSASGPCQPDIVVIFCEKIDITGAVTVSGTASGIPEFDQQAPGIYQKCTTFQHYTPVGDDYPRIQFPTAPLDGHKLQMFWKFPIAVGTSDIAKYAGGNYMTVDGNGFQDTGVDVNDPVASSGTMQINADGSGTLTFKDLAGDSGKIAGTITWTCVDSK
jgi:hypothetical protein